MNAAFFNDGETYVLRGGGEDYRVLAHPTQVPLLKQLPPHRVQLCSVSLFEEQLRQTARNPQPLLERLVLPLELEYAADAGGPRPLTSHELAALELAALDDRELLALTASESNREAFFRVLERHPAVRSGLGFAFNTLLGFSLVRVLRMIYDIRRFGNASQAGRMGKFKMFFRLAGPRLFFMLYRKQGQPGESELLTRTGALVASWMDHPFYQLNAMGLQFPDRFLFREYHRRRDELSGTHSPEEAEVLSVWQTSARLGAFIYRLWVHGVGSTRFSPEKYFTHQDEVDEFKKYCKTLDKHPDGPTN